MNFPMKAETTRARMLAGKVGAPALLIAGNLSPIYLLWLLWPRLEPPKANAGPDEWRLVVDLGLALIFPLQHSLPTQAPIKRWVTGRLTPEFERPFYVMTSAVALVVTVLFWQCSTWEIGSGGTVGLWIARAVFMAMVGLQMWSTQIVGPKFLLGVAHLKAFASGRPLRPAEFREVGPYRMIRHPIAASQFVLIWAVGSLYGDRLVLSVVWSIWIVGATLLEDRRLEKEFGEVYRAYRKRAGFMWPKLLRAR